MKSPENLNLVAEIILIQCYTKKGYGYQLKVLKRDLKKGGFMFAEDDTPKR